MRYNTPMNFAPKPTGEIIEPAIKVVLASQSAGRKSLLEKLAIRFRTVVAHVNEDEIVDKDPERMLKRRASAKMAEVINHPQIYALSDQSKILLITADSEAILGNKTFGKSEDKEDTKNMLKSLMGKTHYFTTSVCIVLLDALKERKRWEKTIKTKVTFRKMTQPEIESYVNRYDFTRFAAAYAVNEAPWDLVTKIDGSYTNVVGLPFEVLLPILRSLKIIDAENK